MRIFNIKYPKAIPIPNQQVDERDTMFARIARTPNTDAYNHYYSNNPHLKKKDDHIRSLPLLLDPKGKYYHTDYSERAGQLFDSIENIQLDEKIINTYTKLFRNAKSDTQVLKNIAIELGAIDAGSTNLEKNFIYSNKGRFDHNYGEIIKLDHKSVFVFLVEMDFNHMSNSPKANVIFESANQYYQAAIIAKKRREGF